MATAKKPPADETTVVPEVIDFPTEHRPEMVEAKALANRDRFPDEELRGITTFEDAFRLATEVYGDVTDVTQELGNGFTLITDKAPLINNPFIIISTNFNEGDFGEFVSIAAVTKDHKKYIFNDGSTGVRNQLFELARTLKRTGGFYAPTGLSASEYDTCANKDCLRARPNAVKTCMHCGDTSEKRGTATTYFLNLAPAPTLP